MDPLANSSEVKHHRSGDEHNSYIAKVTALSAPSMLSSFGLRIEKKTFQDCQDCLRDNNLKNNRWCTLHKQCVSTGEYCDIGETNYTRSDQCVFLDHHRQDSEEVDDAESTEDELQTEEEDELLQQNKELQNEVKTLKEKSAATN